MNRSRTGLLASLGEPAGAAHLRFGTWLLAAVVAGALGYRLWLALAYDFPINDGALFLEFVRALAETFPGLPEAVRYNGIDVPFAYPPLSFWTAAALSRLGLDAMTSVRLAPIVMNAAYVALFALLLLRSGHSRLATGIALLFLVTSLRSFEWLVMGGGLSRGLGSLFLLLTLLAAGVPRAGDAPSPTPGLPRLPLAGLCIAGAILSHLEWGLLATGAFIASRALSAPSVGRFATDLLTAGAIALLGVAPWVGAVLATHGMAPFVAASGTGAWNLGQSAVQIVGLLFDNRGNLCFLLGAAVLIARRDWFWLLFILLCLFLTPRHSLTPVALAVAVLSAHGALAGWALLQRTRLSQRQAAAGAALLVGLTIGWQLHRDQQWDRPFRPLPATTLRAMAWVRTQAPGSRVAVLTPQLWFYDAAAEWFPTLSGATSVTTVQGREWLPDGAFARWVTMDRDLKAAASCADVTTALRAFGPADLLWAQARHECFRAPVYQPIYRGGDVVIYRATGPA